MGYGINCLGVTQLHSRKLEKNLHLLKDNQEKGQKKMDLILIPSTVFRAEN